MSRLVSVITAVYNDEKYISKSVESILNQTFSDFEYIIVDDGSTDRTLDILLELAGKDKRITLLTQNNSGAAAARNLAINSANGIYIAIQDSDDISSPDRLALQVEHLSGSDGNSISCTGFNVINDKDGIVARNNKVYKDINKNILHGSFCACHPTMMFPRSLIEWAGGYNIFYKKTEDYDLILRLLENKARIGKIDKCLYGYRIRANSESSMNDGAYSKRVYENHLNRIKNRPENFSKIEDKYRLDNNYIVKRHAHEIFFSEDYSTYRKVYLKEFRKLPVNGYLLYFFYAMLPAIVRRSIKSVVRYGIRLF